MCVWIKRITNCRLIFTWTLTTPLNADCHPAETQIPFSGQIAILLHFCHIGATPHGSAVALYALEEKQVYHKGSQDIKQSHY